MTADLVLSNVNAYIDKAIVDCSIAIDAGRIVKIGKEANMPAAEARIDLANKVVLPGLIDAHVHLRDEGNAYKEDFRSGTAAAAAGGVTTVLDMPNNDPVTMTADRLRERMRIAEKKALVNVGFYSAFPARTREMQRISDEGAVAFKLFMAQQVGGLDLDDDRGILRSFRNACQMNLTIAVHAEDKATLSKEVEKRKEACQNGVAAYSEAHSELVEAEAVNHLLNIVSRTNVRVHLCHISSRAGLEAIVDARKTGMQVTCEVTPHHLFLCVDDLEKTGAIGLTAPPIRDRSQVQALWEGIRKRWIDVIASDHAPHTFQEKTSDSVWDVKVGIPNLETTLPLLLNAVRKKRLSLGDIVRLMVETPAEIFQLKKRGTIEPGNIADLVVVDIYRKHRIDAREFHSKAKYSPFDGWTVEGKPVKTIANGRLVMDEGEIVAPAGCGEIIRRR